MFLFCLVFAMFCARPFICALWSPAGKGLTSWLSFVVSTVSLFTFPLVSWVRCGTLLYRFLIFAPLLTLKQVTYLLRFYKDTGAHQRRQVDEKWLPLSTDQF